jgi:hypothetical protein
VEAVETLDPSGRHSVRLVYPARKQVIDKGI